MSSFNCNLEESRETNRLSSLELRSYENESSTLKRKKFDILITIIEKLQSLIQEAY